MKSVKKIRDNNLRWLIFGATILLFLFLILDLFFTGYVVNNSQDLTCKSEWQACPNGNPDCCEGLECLGGTCKVGEIINEPLIIEEEVIDLNQCSFLDESCLEKECCEGLNCIENKCQEIQNTCVDSDGGINYYLTGYISGISEFNEEFSYIKDICITEQEVKESYCDNSLVNFESFTCENGCENGVCNCKSLGQSCGSSIECCIGFNCVDDICILQGEEEPDSLENKALCTFFGHPCKIDEDCCSKNCRPTWEFLFWKSDIKNCELVDLKD